MITLLLRRLWLLPLHLRRLWRLRWLRSLLPLHLRRLRRLRWLWHLPPRCLRWLHVLPVLSVTERLNRLVRTCIILGLLVAT